MHQLSVPKTGALSVTKLPNAMLKEIDVMIGKRGNGHFRRQLVGLIISAGVRTGGGHGDVVGYDEHRLSEPFATITVIGAIMEKTEALLKLVNEEISESKKTLQTLHNDITALTDVIHPSLVEQVKRLRDTRMTTVRETHEILQSLRDIRKFFLESAYTEEVERLERFVTLCKEFERLKANGTLDAVTNSAIRLAIKVEGND